MAKEKEKEANATEHQSKPLLLSDRTGQALKPKPKILKKSSHKNLTKVDKSKVTNQRSGKKKKTMVSESKVEKDSIDKEDEKKRNSSETKQKSIEEHNDKNRQSQKIKENLGALQRKKENKKKNKKRSALEKLKSRKDKEKYEELEMNQWKEKKLEKLGGLIFMCSAKTKPDCFRYGVMGVPVSKKELVLSVKPGLKLFLYDFELRLMYGIYEASSSGGVKLEPTAFNGAFPVQVRFGVQEDCYPLPENVFRKAIKDNYNENQKFDTQLSVKQVKKLIELFQPVELHSKSLAIDPQPIVSVQNREVVEKARKSRLHSYNEPSLHSYEVRRYAVRPYEDHQHIPYREVPLTEKDELYQNTFLTEKEYRTYGLRGERPKPSQLSTIDPHTHDEFGRYYLLPREDNRHIPYKEVSLTQNNDLRHDTFLTEKEYRTYGLRRERPNLTPPKSEAFPKSYVREDLLRQPSFIYRDVASQQGEPSRRNPLLMNERECQDYGIGTNGKLQQSIPSVNAAADSILDSYPRYQHYSSHYGTSSMDPYAPISRRDEVHPSGSHTLGRNRETYPVETVHLPRNGIYLTETNHLSRRGIYPTDIDPSRRKNDDVERLYSTYASHELSDYNRNHNYKGAMPEPSHAPVSSRYSFAGSSLSHQ